MLASYKGQDDNVEFLLQNNANPNTKDSIGSYIDYYIGCALAYAIMESQTNAFQALLDAGADTNLKDISGDSLL